MQSKTEVMEKEFDLHDALWRLEGRIIVSGLRAMGMASRASCVLFACNRLRLSEFRDGNAGGSVSAVEEAAKSLCEEGQEAVDGIKAPLAAIHEISDYLSSCHIIPKAPTKQKRFTVIEGGASE